MYKRQVCMLMSKGCKASIPYRLSRIVKLPPNARERKLSFLNKSQWKAVFSCNAQMCIRDRFWCQLFMEFGYFSDHFFVPRSKASNAFSSVGAW